MRSSMRAAGWSATMAFKVTLRYPPTIEDYESPQRDKLNQLMGPDPTLSKV
jgi:hypothetical protein